MIGLGVRVFPESPNIEDKCYGSTAGSNPAGVGSTPTSSAKIKSQKKSLRALFLFEFLIYSDAVPAVTGNVIVTPLAPPPHTTIV